MDTPATESNQPLSLSEAASLFGGGEQPEQREAPEAKAPVAESADPPKDDAEVVAEAPEVDEASAEPEKVTIEVDGKTVELTKAELADHYKNGLRQADYTKKTMEAAELRKAADAETSKAREERQKYTQGLQQAQAVLQAQLQEQGQIDWQKLLDTDPVEYMKQDRIARERHAKLQQVQAEQQQLGQQDRAEAKKRLVTHLQSEHQALLDKLPEWKDEKKAGAEREAIVKELIDRGFERERIFGEADADGTPKLENPGLVDHRILLMARDAMLYRQMLSKATAAAKKVSTLPQKVERPGGGETNALDGRTAAMKRLQKSGSLRDAAAALEGIFK